MPDGQLYSLDKLREIDDTEDFILQVITIFLETVPANTEALVKACAEKDWDQVYFFSHKIKANVSLLSIDSIIDDVKFVEQSAKNGINMELLPCKAIFINETINNVTRQIKQAFLL